MQIPLVPCLLTCGPAVVSSFAFARMLKEHGKGRASQVAVWAAGGAWSITAYATCIFTRYTLRPRPDLPPWEDPETLGLAMLFFLAPAGIGLTAIAGVRGASRWVVAPLVAALLVLFVVGVLVSGTV